MLEVALLRSRQTYNNLSWHHGRMGEGARLIEVALWDPDRDAVMVCASGDGPRLPRLDVRDDGFGSAVPAALQRLLGVNAVLLEPLGIDTYVLELRTGAISAPVGYRWLGVEDAQNAEDLGGDTGRLADWLGRRSKPLRPWFEPGWYSRALAFADSELAGLGLRRAGPVRQIKHWAVSSVLRIPTDRGLVYLKASPPGGFAEPRLLRFLAQRWAHAVPDLLASSDTAEMWLTADFGDVDGWKVAELERVDALSNLAEIQVSLSTDVDALAELGVPRLDPRQLAERIPGLLGRADLWNAIPGPRDHWRGLTDQQRSTWLSLGPWLAERCLLLAETVEDSMVPLSLVHGDFHPGNTARHCQRFVLHDWNFAEVSHPFFDLARWLHDTSATAAHAYLAHYLARWDNPQVWRLAKPAAALYEVDKVVRMTDEFTSAHAFSMIAVVYGWVRRLLGAFADPDCATPNWPQIQS